MGALEAVQAELDLQRQGISPKSTIRLQGALARHNTEVDLGTADDGGRTAFDYGLDDETRDRLIVHAREDASLAVIIASANQNRLVRIERVAWALLLLGFVLVGRSLF